MLNDLTSKAMTPIHVVLVPPGQLQPLRPYLPGWMFEYSFLGLTVVQWLGLIFFVVLAGIIGMLLQTVVLRIGGMIVSRTKSKWDDSFIALLAGPLQLFLILFVLSQLLPLLEMELGADGFLRSLLACGLIVAITWFLLRVMHWGAAKMQLYFTLGVEGTPQARAIHTQISVVKTIIRFILTVAAVALVLMQFEVARSVGVSLLASAGIAGIAVGFAAQRTVATLFAGIQLAFTQVVKIGDAVNVEGQFGTVEDIRLTYVVIKVWDLRRLIIPVTYFVEKPIENWTATSTDLMGTVFLYTDYNIPIEEIRTEVQKILDQTELWDKQVQTVAVTNLTDQSVEVRILVSAANSGRLWDLRCLIREKMLTWLQTQGKKYLPVQRMEWQGKALAEDGKQ